MLLTEIVNSLVTLLNTHKAKITSLPDVSIIATLDWESCLKKTRLQVLVVPEFNQYNLDASQGRRKHVNVSVTKSISIMVGKGFSDLPTSDDIAPWSESTELVNIRERITEVIMMYFSPATLQLTEIEEIPIDELELNHRNFIAVTQYGFEDIKCGSGPNLLSS